MVRAALVEALLSQAIAWAQARTDVVALVLVGSWARGTPREDSDVDVVVVVEDMKVLIEDTRWVESFGAVATQGRKDFGLVRSVFVTYESGMEVEWCIADRRWLSTSPVDVPSARVVAAGARVLHDPHGLARAFVEAASSKC